MQKPNAEGTLVLQKTSLTSRPHCSSKPRRFGEIFQLLGSHPKEKLAQWFSSKSKLSLF